MIWNKYFDKKFTLFGFLGGGKEKMELCSCLLDLKRK